VHIRCKPGEESGQFLIELQSGWEYCECVFALPILRGYIQCNWLLQNGGKYTVSV
jgi:hypothetical protein